MTPPYALTRAPQVATPAARPSRLRGVRWITICLALVAFSGCDRFGSPEKATFQAVDITGAKYTQPTPMQDQAGQERTLADFKGKVVVLFFGYTQCPDVCPTTMAELAQVKKALGPDGAKVQGIFVTVDPERDTPEVLKTYLANFDPSFVALRGTPEQTAAFAKSFKVFYEKVPGKTPGSYSMDHTAGSYVIGADGRVRLFTRYGAGPQALTSDLKVLLAAG